MQSTLPPCRMRVARVGAERRSRGAAALLATALLLGLSDGVCAATAAPAGFVGAERLRLNGWPAGAPSPDFSLRDTRGAPRTMQSFRGYITIVTFGYANCPDACSLELQKLAVAMHRLGALRSNVRVLFVTLDPARDTPTLLGKFVHSFDPTFIALRGTSKQTNEAISSFSLESERLGGDGGKGGYLIDHTIEEFVFDRGGRLRLVGAAASTAVDIAHDLAALITGPGRTAQAAVPLR